jgi:hypothetical protein
VLFKGAGNFVRIVAHALHCLLPVPFQNLTHGRNRGGFRPMSGWNHQACSSGFSFEK